MQPGELVTPGADGPPSSPAENDQPPVDEQPTPTPQQHQSEAPFVVKDGDIAPANDNEDELSWTASEFIEHQKPQGWYMSVAAGALVVSALLYVVLRDLITPIVIGITAILFGVVGARKPRAMTYRVSRSGLQVGEKKYAYSTFKSFSVIEEGAIDSIQFFPLKRFVPPISIYFPPEQGEQIVALLADYLPHEDRDHDPIDRLMKRMHF